MPPPRPLPLRSRLMRSTLSRLAWTRACPMVIQPAGDTVMPRLVAWWRQIRTNVFESVKRRSDNTSPVLRSRKTDCDRERFVLRDASRWPRGRPRPRDHERPRWPSPWRSREAERPRGSPPLACGACWAPGVAATGPAPGCPPAPTLPRSPAPAGAAPPAPPVLAFPAEAIAATAAGRGTASASCRSGAQSAGASFGQAAAVVRVASVGAGVVRVSWLARTVIDAFFFSPPDWPGACPRRTRSTQCWRALPPPRPVEDTSPGRSPTKSHACLQEAADDKGLVKISLHWPSVG